MKHPRLRGFKKRRAPINPSLPPILHTICSALRPYTNESISLAIGSGRETYPRIRAGKTDPKLSFVLALAKIAGYKLILEKDDES